MWGFLIVKLPSVGRAFPHGRLCSLDYPDIFQFILGATQASGQGHESNVHWAEALVVPLPVLPLDHLGHKHPAASPGAPETAHQPQLGLHVRFLVFCLIFGLLAGDLLFLGMSYRDHFAEFKDLWGLWWTRRSSALRVLKYCGKASMCVVEV